MLTMKNVDWKVIRSTLNKKGYKVVKVREPLTTRSGTTYDFQVTLPQQKNYDWYSIVELVNEYCKQYEI